MVKLIKIATAYTRSQLSITSRYRLSLAISFLSTLGACHPHPLNKEGRAAYAADISSCTALAIAGNPFILANKAIKNGDYRVFQYLSYGNEASTITPGTKGVPEVSLVYTDRNLTHAMNYDHQITQCGQGWIRWAIQYNRRICEVAGYKRRDKCEPDWTDS